MPTFYVCWIPSHSSYAFSFDTGIFAIWRFKRVYQTAAISSPKLFYLRCLSIKNKTPRKKQGPIYLGKRASFSSWGLHWSIDLVTCPNPTKLHRPAKNAPNGGLECCANDPPPRPVNQSNTVLQYTEQSNVLFLNFFDHTFPLYIYLIGFSPPKSLVSSSGKIIFTATVWFHINNWGMDRIQIIDSQLNQKNKIKSRK